MEITKEQLAIINGLDSKKEIKAKLNEWFGVKKLEIGKWYKSYDGLIFCFQGKYSTDGDSGSYGFGFTGKFYESIGVEKNVNHYLATEKEVEEALRKEGVRLGFVKGVSFKSTTGTNFVFKDFWFQNILIDMMMWSSYGGVIFDNGKWGELIQRITKEEAEKQLGKIIID